MDSNRYRIFGAPEALQKDVECFIVNGFHDEEGTTIKVFSNGIPGIVFHQNDGHPAIESIVTQSGRRFSPPTLFLCGPGTESSAMHFGKGSYGVIQVIFRPHALKSLFGINALSLKDAAVELYEFSMEDIQAQWMEAHDGQEWVTLLTNFLLDKLTQAKARDLLIEESLRCIHQCAGRVTVNKLAKHLDLSERQFERRFGQTVGIAPQAYIRVRRFNEALRLMKSRQYGTLTEIAHALNFHDQSHFIRDIKTFTGVTPKSLAQKVDDFFYNQAGYSYI